MFTAEFYELVTSMMATTTKRRIRKADRAKKCIVPGCCEPQVRGRRDVCKTHWNQFDYGRKLAKKKGAAALKRYEREEVRAGRIGPAHRGSSCDCKNQYKTRAVQAG